MRASILDKKVRVLWGREKMEFMAVDFEGAVGGLLWIWDPGVFQISGCYSSRIFILLSGSLFYSFECVILNLYAPNEVGNRGKLWESLLKLKEEFPKPWYPVEGF
ncbi:hypothetical protein CsSME_00002736 [Camellia sinensis var. sinensis]